MSKSLPSVLIIGRTNVGKSTLFNRLSSNVKSMTLDYEGVTRDFIRDTISWKDRTFDLVDTGGISLRKTTDPILEKARQGALDWVKQADIVLFVCDGKVGAVPEDREIGKLLHKMAKTVYLIVNKMDTKASQENLHEFRTLGFDPIIPVSAEHAYGIGDILDRLSTDLPAKSLGEQQPLGCRVVLLGKPNVGKSSLMNLLVKQERAIVSDIAGTTREALSEKISFYSEDIMLTDTPGIRKKGSVEQGLEEMMVKTSFRALQNAEIVLLLVDASQGKISDQELKLAFYAFTEQHKALAILFNKQDLTTDESKSMLADNMSEYKFILKKIPQLSISCQSGKNVGKVLPLVQELAQRHQQKLSSDEITMLFKKTLEKKPLMHKTMPLMVFSAEQIKTAPMTIRLTVNESEWFEESQLAFFENLLRAHYDLVGVPVVFVIRKRRIVKK